MTTPTPQPTAEQIAHWCNSTLGLPMHLAREDISKLAYAAGHAAALEELRAGGVGLPEPFMLLSGARKNAPDEELTNLYRTSQLLDYGDRRVAAKETEVTGIAAHTAKVLQGMEPVELNPAANSVKGYTPDQLAAAIHSRDEKIADLQRECRAWSLTVDNLEVKTP